MLTEIIMPKLGETMEEGIINKWRKREGERVEKGEILFDVMTDKANFEVEAPESGVVRKIIAKEEETVPVTKVVGYIASSMEERVPSSPAAAIPKHAFPSSAPHIAAPPETGSPYAETGDRIKASPMARRLAGEKGVDLSKIKGSGPAGRIEKEDVLKAAERAGSSAAVPIQAVVPEGADVIPVKGIRKIMAERMIQSKQTIPHFYLNTEADMTEAVEIRERLKKQKIHFSHNDLIIKAVAEALGQFPVVNGYFAGDKIVLNPSVNIGIAVARPSVQKSSSGKEVDLSELVVPVVKGADKKSVLEIAGIARELVKKVRDNKLGLDELEGGTFIVSNLGAMGIDAFSAIISPTQAAILAVGEIKKRPVVAGEKIEIRSTVKFSLSCDHRIVDGATGARFLQKVRALLEDPHSLLPR